ISAAAAYQRAIDTRLGEYAVVAVLSLAQLLYVKGGAVDEPIELLEKIVASGHPRFAATAAATLDNVRASINDPAERSPNAAPETRSAGPGLTSKPSSADADPPAD